MNDKLPLQQSGSLKTMIVPLADNEYIKELFCLLNDNGKDTSGLTALLDYVQDIENFVEYAENNLAEMQSQLATVQEIQNRPVRYALQNSVRTLENRVNIVMEQVAVLKANIIEGCQNAIVAFKEQGISTLDNLAAFFHVQSGLQAIGNSITTAIQNCDKAIKNVETFSKEFHETGRHIKNMGRAAVGKQLLEEQSKSGKLAETLSAPYRTQKSCLLGIQASVHSMIDKLEQLSQSVQQVPRRRSLKERLQAGKEKDEQQTMKTLLPERSSKTPGLQM